MIVAVSFSIIAVEEFRKSVYAKTGFICETVDEAPEKINEINQINRMDCYNHVKENFSAEKMAKGYVSAYEKIIGKK